MRQLVEFAKETATGIVESGEEHRLIALIETKAGVVAADLQELPKEVCMAVLRQLLGELEATSYVLVGEAWMTDSQRPGSEGVRVRDLPPDDRCEVLMVSAVRKGEAQPRAQFAVIDCTPEGRRLRAWQSMDGGTMTGRMVLTEW